MSACKRGFASEFTADVLEVLQQYTYTLVNEVDIYNNENENRWVNETSGWVGGKYCRVTLAQAERWLVFGWAFSNKLKLRTVLYT